MKPKSSSNKLNVWSEVKSALDLSALDFDDQVKSQVQVQLDAPLRLFLKPESERVLIKAQKYLKLSHGHHGSRSSHLVKNKLSTENTFLKLAHMEDHLLEQGGRDDINYEKLNNLLITKLEHQDK